MNTSIPAASSEQFSLPRKEPPPDLVDSRSFSYEDCVKILCINCQDYIDEDDIEPHSKLCFTISETVKRMDLYSPLVQVRFKLEKVKALLNTLTNPRPGDSNYTSIFLRLIGKLLEVKETTDGEKNKQVIEALSSLMISFKGSTALLIYGERLKSLANEQMFSIKEVGDDQTTDARNTRPPQKSMAFNQLASVKSDTSSIVSRNTDFAQSSIPTEEQSNFEIAEATDSADEVDYQRYFYSQCLAVKLTYSSRSQAQYVSIPKLYNEAKHLQLPLEDWASFIRQQLKNPEHWLDSLMPKRSTTMRSRHSQPKNLPSPRFDAIIEEDTQIDLSRRF